MKFSLRDLLWAMATIAMIAALTVKSGQQASYVRAINEHLFDAERRAEGWKRKADEMREMQEKQSQEILGLRHLLKQSLGDQRKWFELQVEDNRIIAIGPATSESVEVTPRVVDIAEGETGLDGRRLRHFLTPIEQLKISR